MDLSKYNADQRKAIEATEGPMMILAGAGSGKTRTLVGKIQYLIEDKKVFPYQILALTFSNKAAKEMADRVSMQLRLDNGSLAITTFHAFCAKVLRTQAQYLGLSKHFTIYDDSETLSLIKNILGRRGFSQKDHNPQDIKYYISNLKNDGYYIGCKIRPESIQENPEFYSIYCEYEQELSKSNAVDFGGLIVGVVQLLEQFPQVLDYYKNRYKYILVDEYQDTNRAQFDLVTLLASAHKNICVVGDEDQSIYSWRGADIRNILDYETVYPNAQILKLEQNYRSSQRIIEAASAVIANNTQRKGKTLWTANPEGELIDVVECKDDREESLFIAEKIIALKKENVLLSDVAIFYRNNAQSRSIEEALIRSKVAYRIVAGIKFYERKEVKDMIAYMRLITNPKDSLALTRIINTPTRGIGLTSLRKLEDYSISKNQSLWETLLDITQNEDSEFAVSKKILSVIRQFVSLIQEAQIMENDEAKRPSDIYEKLLTESGYQESLKIQNNYEAKARIENLEELHNALLQFEQMEENPSVNSFLESITLDTSVEGDSQEKELVSLMTIHGSKGLEYPHVFIVGAEENIFPSYMSIESGEMQIEEERRLFYVAMTRAMEKLTIYYARGRMLFGSIKFNGPSRFLEEIPEQYRHWKQSKKQNNFEQNYYSDREYSDDYSQDVSYDFDPVYQTGASKNKSQYHKGVHIRHQLYGEGIIENAQGIGADEKITVLFPGGIRKKFMVKFSPIEVIERYL